MSFADDFGHCIPPDDYPEGCSYPRKYTSRYNSYSDRGSKMIKKRFISVTYETEKAYLLSFFEGKAWFPKSKIEINTTSLIINVPSWLWNRIRFIKD